MNKRITKVGKYVLSYIMTSNRPIKPQDLVSDLDMNLRTARYALKMLEDAELINRLPDLTDLRSYYYSPRNDELALASIKNLGIF